MNKIRTMYFRHELDDMFEEMLNEQEPVSICGIFCDQGHAYRLIDEIAFRCDVNDWADNEFDEVNFEDCTPKEIEHYRLSSHQYMYCRKVENNE